MICNVKQIMLIKHMMQTWAIIIAGIKFLVIISIYFMDSDLFYLQTFLIFPFKR